MTQAIREKTDQYCATRLLKSDKLGYQVVCGLLCLFGVLGWFGLDPLMLLDKTGAGLVFLVLLSIAAGSWLKSRFRMVVKEELDARAVLSKEKPDETIERQRQDAANELNEWFYKEHRAKVYLHEQDPHRFPDLKPWDGYKSPDELGIDTWLPYNYDYRIRLEQLKKSVDGCNEEAMEKLDRQ